MQTDLPYNLAKVDYTQTTHMNKAMQIFLSIDVWPAFHILTSPCTPRRRSAYSTLFITSSVQLPGSEVPSERTAPPLSDL